MNNKFFVILITVILLNFPAISADTKDGLNIITATSDLSDMVKVIGQKYVEVRSLSKGNQDMHFVEPKPSMVIKVKNADVLVRIGMDLDLWLQSIIDTSRNSKVMFGASGYLDASEKINKLEVPAGKIDASMGDIHIYGNPHYWLDPENAKLILESILDKLCKLLPSQTEYFQKNYQDYLKKLDSYIIKWKEIIKPFNGEKIVTYHNSWTYFANRFGLKIIDFIETKPGIPPTPSHISSLIEKIKKEKVKVIIVEPYFNIKVAESIGKTSGTRILVLPISVGGLPETTTYIDLLEYNIIKLVASFKK